ncbi:unnamed protein product [Nyctereutes procyonoides]|uniref:(raccoon dog) hypothetical protein n=1 Tax=Nyctereutes procyonoides TaxID=34880 RepID=A0A811ZUV2_NYCPR|nr:unnamed protein product [Nyctereutes procyonoides]
MKSGCTLRELRRCRKSYETKGICPRSFTNCRSCSIRRGHGEATCPRREPGTSLQGPDSPTRPKPQAVPGSLSQLGPRPRQRTLPDTSRSEPRPASLQAKKSRAAAACARKPPGGGRRRLRGGAPTPPPRALGQSQGPAAQAPEGGRVRTGRGPRRGPGPGRRRVSVGAAGRGGSVRVCPAAPPRPPPPRASRRPAPEGQRAHSRRGGRPPGARRGAAPVSARGGRGGRASGRSCPVGPAWARSSPRGTPRTPARPLRQVRREDAPDTPARIAAPDAFGPRARFPRGRAGDTHADEAHTRGRFICALFACAGSEDAHGLELQVPAHLQEAHARRRDPVAEVVVLGVADHRLRARGRAAGPRCRAAP